MPAKEQLLIRFRGICGHIDLPNGANGNGTKKKRTVLVRHQSDDAEIEPHVPYIEFLADDVVPSPGLELVTYTRPGDNARYARVNLTEPVEIRLKDVRPGKVSEQLSFQRDVPHIAEILGEEPAVAGGLLAKNAQDVPRALVSGVFDMPEGLLVGGEPEAKSTRFPTGVPFKERRLARWSDLFTTYEPPLVVQLVPLGGGDAQEITFRETLRMITIGNEPKRLIVGVTEAGQDHDHDHDHGGGNGEPLQPTGHFVLYYNLLESPPAKKPVPIPAQIDGVGCPNNNFP
jgi:hypothetical protein